MSTDTRRHSSFASTEKPTRAAFNALSMSINDVMPVTSATDQAAAASALAGSGVALSSHPIVTVRADAPGLHAIEYSYNGSGFAPASGVLHFSSTSARDTWTSSNSALLTTEDVCVVVGVMYRWESAWVPFRSFYAAYSSAAQSIPTSTNTVITFGSAVVSKSDDMSVSGGVVTVNTPGVYLVVGSAAYQGTNTTGVRAIAVSRNGAIAPGGWNANGGMNTTQVFPCALMLTLAAGDTIGLNAYQSSGASLALNAASGGYESALRITRVD